MRSTYLASLHSDKKVSYVKQAFLSNGSGILDFESAPREIMPDYFIVNADEHIVENLFPNMMNDGVADLIDEYRNFALGWKLSGAGGGIFNPGL